LQEVCVTSFRSTNISITQHLRRQSVYCCSCLFIIIIIIRKTIESKWRGELCHELFQSVFFFSVWLSMIKSRGIESRRIDGTADKHLIIALKFALNGKICKNATTRTYRSSSATCRRKNCDVHRWASAVWFNGLNILSATSCMDSSTTSFVSSLLVSSTTSLSSFLVEHSSPWTALLPFSLFGD
jgi:hypothetical protein